MAEEWKIIVSGANNYRLNGAYGPTNSPEKEVRNRGWSIVDPRAQIWGLGEMRARFEKVGLLDLYPSRTTSALPSKKDTNGKAA